MHSTFYYKNFVPDDNYLYYATKLVGTKTGEKSKLENILLKDDVRYKTISPLNIEYRLLNKAMQHYFTFANEGLKVPIYKVACAHPDRVFREKEPAIGEAQSRVLLL